MRMVIRESKPSLEFVSIEPYNEKIPDFRVKYGATSVQFSYKLAELTTTLFFSLPKKSLGIISTAHKPFSVFSIIKILLPGQFHISCRRSSFMKHSRTRAQFLTSSNFLEQ